MQQDGPSREGKGVVVVNIASVGAAVGTTSGQPVSKLVDAARTQVTQDGHDPRGERETSLSLSNLRLYNGQQGAPKAPGCFTDPLDCAVRIEPQVAGLGHIDASRPVRFR
jgi:hypothetical protein